MQRTSTNPRRRLSEHVVDALQTEIVGARLTAGERMPTEAELAARFDVSRTVVREAVRMLVQRGLVDVRPGRGMMVAEFDGQSIVDQYDLMLQISEGTFIQLMDMRMVLEVEIAALAAEVRTEKDVQAMQQAINLASSHRDDREICLGADLAFHRAVAQASGNPFFTLVIRPVNDFLRRAYAQAFGYLANQKYTIEEHQAICNVIAARDPDGARAATQQHLERITRRAAELTLPAPARGAGEERSIGIG